MGVDVPVAAITSDFEQLHPPATAADGEPIFRGTHQYGYATIERTYYLTGGVLAVETAYMDGEETLTTVDESWLLDDDGRHVRRTGQDLAAFCHEHHYRTRGTDLEFCLDGTADSAAEQFPDAEITSTFQPATTVRVEDGAALRYEGSHEAGQARVEREFFVTESSSEIRIRTTYAWAEESLGSIRQAEELIDGGEFVAATGEPVDAFCRRTHLADPAADVRYCARIGTAGASDVPASDGSG
jgi:hypothetical protein